MATTTTNRPSKNGATTPMADRAAPPAPTRAQETITITEIRREHIYGIRIIGRTPLLYNAVSEKAMRELLWPRGPLTKAQKAGNIKHDPVQEYRDSVYRLRGGPTLLGIPAAMMKHAIAFPATDLPDKLTRAKTDRLVWVDGEMVPVYGRPQLHMTIVRMANPARTPDIRTRAILPEWCAEFDVTYVDTADVPGRGLLNRRAVMQLIASAGMLSGIGDGRNQKGALNYGSFDLVVDGDRRAEAEYERIKREGGRAAQEADLFAEQPYPYDYQTERLLNYYAERLNARGVEGDAPDDGEEEANEDGIGEA